MHKVKDRTSGGLLLPATNPTRSARAPSLHSPVRYPVGSGDFWLPILQGLRGMTVTEASRGTAIARRQRVKRQEKPPAVSCRRFFQRAVRRSGSEVTLSANVEGHG